MKNITYLLLSTFCITFFLSTITSAQTSPDQSESPPVVDLILVDYTFGGPESIPSGWTTFRMHNKGSETHEFVLHRLPDSISYNDMHRQVIQPMDSLEQLLHDGKIDSARHQKALQQAFPKWIGKVQLYGGGGLISPGQQSNITLNLDPGTYVMTCFIPSANGQSHRSQGMVRPITVTDRSPRQTAPEEDVMITSSGHQITQEGELGFGQQTVAFHVEKPAADSINPYLGMSLAQLTDPMDQQEDLRDFEANPPSIPLLGGALAIPPGDTAYVSVKLTVSGPYNLVFTNGEDKPKFREFVVK